MSVHFEIERTFKDDTSPSVLIEGWLPSEWASRSAIESRRYGFKPREFATKGGARNYIHKYGLSRVTVVRVCSAQHSQPESQQ